VTISTESDPLHSRIAVAIPCLNEAAAIASVISEFRAALPEAELVVFDNNSTDGTGTTARSLGVRVVDVPEQGKGYAVQAAFQVLADYDVVVLTDGDGTYPAGSVGELVGPVLRSEADMVVGARQPAAGAGAMTLTRGLGNLLIRSAFRLLIGSANRDLLSGYRAFGRNYRDSVRLRSPGFEIETELTSEAVARRLKIVEIPVPYYRRIAGTQSKLSAFRDGRRIFGTILTQSLRLRPERPVLLWLVPTALLAVTVNWSFAAAAGLGLVTLWCIRLADIRRWAAWERQRPKSSHLDAFSGPP
jgi:glycosyltransferase involved in cell wall biosynthesis